MGQMLNNAWPDVECRGWTCVIPWGGGAGLQLELCLADDSHPEWARGVLR